MARVFSGRVLEGEEEHVDKDRELAQVGGAFMQHPRNCNPGIVSIVSTADDHGVERIVNAGRHLSFQKTSWQVSSLPIKRCSFADSRGTGRRASLLKCAPRSVPISRMT
jgi:hypothetical protein